MDPVEIFIYDVIGQGSAAAVVQQIREAGKRPIKVRINSPGGDVFEGYAIYNALLAHVPGVTTQIDGLAASIAAIIAMAGKNIVMAENAMLMIHAPSQDLGSANATSMRKSAELLDKITSSLTDAIVRRTKLDREQVTAMLDGETYMTAAEAKEFGFIDEISAPLEVAAHFDKLNLSSAPEWVKNRVNPMEIKSEAEAKSLLDKIRNLFPSILANFAAAATPQAEVKYLVPDGKHLPYTGDDGKPDHHLMGAAWAALHGGYRGNKYDGPDKDKAIEKLKGIYKSEGMETPKDEATVELGVQVVDVATAVRDATVPLNLQITDLTTQVSVLQTQITGLTTERDTAKAAEKAAKDRVTLIEGYAKTKGLDLTGVKPEDAVSVDPNAGPGDKVTAADFATRMKSAKTPAARKKVRDEFEAAVKAGKILPAAA